MIGDYVEYRDGGLYWVKLTRGSNAKVGDRVGSVQPTGYRRFKFKGQNILEHRAIWEVLNGSIPDGFQIDHIDRDRSNNRIENLRLVTPTGNSHNRESSGYYWSKPKGKFIAQIRNMGKRLHIGAFDNEEDARGAYLEAKGAYI